MRVPLDLPDQLHTPRLGLGPLGPGDADAWRAAIDASDQHLRPWIPFMAAEPRSVAQTRVYLASFADARREGTALRYALRAPRQAAVLGEVMLLATDEPGLLEVGYWLHVDHTGRGLAGEALDAVLVAGARHPRVSAVRFRCETGNPRSRRLPARRGATCVGVEPLDGGRSLETWRLTLDARLTRGLR